MGIGKTSATLAAIDAMKMLGENIKPLILAPKRVAEHVWVDECKKWNFTQNYEVSVITGSVKDRVASLRVKADIYTTNYEQLPWLVEYLGDNWDFNMVVADEATRLKSFRTRQGGKRAKALSYVAHSKVNRFVELTGTPAPNGLLDLWGQIWMLDRGERLCKTMSAYRETYFSQDRDGFNYSIRSASAEAAIHNKLKDICLPVRAEDYFPLEEHIITNVEVDLPRDARIAYRKMAKELLIEIENHEITAANAAVKTMKLIQIGNGAAYVDGDKKAWKSIHDAKLDALDSVIEEIGKPVIVVYNLISDLARIRAKFKNAETLEDEAALKRWNAGKVPILLLHPQSAGHGLSLQYGGHHMVFFSLDWNLENRLQIIERIGAVRQLQAGFKRNVFIYNIVARDTMDDVILSKIAGKKLTMESLINNLKRGSQL